MHAGLQHHVYELLHLQQGEKGRGLAHLLLRVTPWPPGQAPPRPPAQPLSGCDPRVHVRGWPVCGPTCPAGTANVRAAFSEGGDTPDALKHLRAWTLFPL